VTDALRATSPADQRRRFDAIFSVVAGSETLATIWRDVYGDDLPGNDAIPFSFVTKTELTTLAHDLGLDASGRLVDVACGQGAPGLFVARQTGASLIGIDSSSVALDRAAVLARRQQTAACFVVADAAAIALASGSIDAVMSIDALQLMPDRPAVLAEVARILKPGGCFACTTWVARSEAKGPPFPVDYAPLLTAAGLTLESDREPALWQQRESAVFACILQGRNRLRTELGDEVAGMLTVEAERMPAAYQHVRRVNLVARKVTWGSREI
jgi:SAM-dependent methyltransferase